MFQSQDEDTYTFDYALYAELREFRRRNNTLRQCASILDQFLFNDLKLEGAKPHLQAFIRSHLLPFLRTVLANILLVGWSPYKLVKFKFEDSKDHVLIPSNVPIHLLNPVMTVNSKTFEHKFRFMEEDGKKERKDVHVLFYSDMHDLVDCGLINSVTYSTLHDHRFVQRIRQFTLQSEFIRSNPTIYLQREKPLPDPKGQSGTFSRTDGPALGLDRNFARARAPALNSLNPSIRQQVTAESASESMADNLAFHEQQMMLLRARQQREYRNMGSENAPQHQNNTYVCAPGTVLAATPHLPQSRTDQVAMEQDLTSKIFRAFGIPESLSGNQKLTVRDKTKGQAPKTTIMEIITFQSRLEHMQSFFKTAFIDIYKRMFDKTLDPGVITFRPPVMYELFLKSLTEETHEEPREKPREKADDTELSDDDALDTGVKKRQRQTPNDGRRVRATEKEDATR